MGILLAFAPFIVYVIVEWLAGITPGLIAATLPQWPCSSEMG
jgi:hypothetical protein